MYNIIAIVQARMGSTRLPGKVLKSIQGKSVLEHVVNRLRISRHLSNIIVATTVNQCDDELVKECNKIGVSFYRGSEEDVLSRYYYAAKEAKADIVVRITSDCPLIDPYIIDKMLEEFVKQYNESKIDYMSNTLTRTFPRGLDAEIISYETLEKAFKEATKGYEREHVTPYIYHNFDKFKLKGFENSTDYSTYRWTLDTPEDLIVIEKIYQDLYREGSVFSLEDSIDFNQRHPEVKRINEFTEQKKLGY